MSSFPMPDLPSSNVEDAQLGRAFIVAYLNNTPAWYLATLDAQGRPFNRPMSLFTEHEGTLYFATQRHKDVFEQLSVAPSCSISAYIPKAGWLRLDAEVKLADENVASILDKKFLAENESHYKHYLGDSEDNVFFALVNPQLEYHRCHKEINIAL